MSDPTMELVPVGEDARDPSPGDLLLCHRRGFASWTIRTGERLRTRAGALVSHAAFVEGEITLIEALTRAVVRSPLSNYREIEYWLVRTRLNLQDREQALAFARSCLGQKYGFLTDFGIALRFLTPGRGLWFGADGTQICSGLAAQTQVRGPVIYPFEPASCAPSELYEFYAR